MSTIDLMNQELDFLESEVVGSVEDNDFKDIVFPEELREIYDPEEVLIERFESIDELVDSVLERQLSYSNSMESMPMNGQVNFHEIAQRLGAETYGMYLPFHAYNKCGRWGIYLFKEPIRAHSRYLFENQKAFLGTIGLSLNQIEKIFIYSVFRHETFHYQVESFATRIEMVQQKPIYLPFKYKIDPLVAHSQHWLEEALAEASVVRSRYVANKNKDIKSIYISNMYKWHLNLMPPGYRDWECTLYGGPDEAHRYFASQLVEVSKDPGAILPKSMTVKSLNLHDFSSVPTYWVSADKMSRIY